MLYRSGAFEGAGNGAKHHTSHEGRVPDQRLFFRSTRFMTNEAEQFRGTSVGPRDGSKYIEADQRHAEVVIPHRASDSAASFSGMVGAGPGIQQVYSLVKQAAQTDITVLILGESGTGKELVAKALHQNSHRAAGSFVTVDCGSIPEALIESELFGYEPGSFTGATHRHVGAFERAHRGTIFLDEIGDMPLALQVRLLRALQEREIRRVGGSLNTPVDIRVVAASNKDLQRAVDCGNFRADLFYRISAFPVAIPSLRDRTEDIPPLARHFLKNSASRVGKPIAGISPAAMRVLLQHTWPGNVRELENVIERAVLLETAPVLRASSFPVERWRVVVPRHTQRPRAILTIEDAERRAMVTALEFTGWNMTRASQALGINRATLHRKVKKFAITRAGPIGARHNKAGPE